MFPVLMLENCGTPPVLVDSRSPRQLTYWQVAYWHNDKVAYFSGLSVCMIGFWHSRSHGRSQRSR
jgi:hypothetical protein